MGGRGNRARAVALAGVAAGLAGSPLLAGRPQAAALAGGCALGFGAALLLLRRAPGSRIRGEGPLPLALLALAACGVGLWLGVLRLAAIDGGALRLVTDRPVRLVGTVVSVPRRADGEVEVEVDGAAGKLEVVAPEPVPELPMGAEVIASGSLREPEPWLQGFLRRRGIAQVLEAERIALTGDARGGLAGRFDSIRERAQLALGRGIEPPEAALARGFVLGEDDRIEARTREDFKRSGLAHLLAVSGQNVLLLCLLAWPLLALLGVGLRFRLLALLVLIATYVVVTGAGPSIQRAGVMGAAGVVAGLSSRPRSRWYVLVLAAAVTLLLNPRAGGDVGWQLSFAATAGIALWAQRLSALLAPPDAGAARRALAEGAAVTAAATLATAPLMAFQFESFSVAALPANLAALPAVAPAMWLGMLAGIAGQLPALPVEPLNWLNSLLLGYIAQVAHVFSKASWAQLELTIPGVLALLALCAALFGAIQLALVAAERRRGLRPSPGPSSPRTNVGQTRRLGLAGTVAGLTLLVGVSLAPAPGPQPPVPNSFEARFLDVGQGDAILLDPPRSDPVLVDAGPPGAELAERLRAEGIESLAALIVTHDQSDHAGGALELISSLRVERLGFARLGSELRRAGPAAGAQLTPLSEGSELRAGALRLSVLWPPAELLRGPAEEPNRLALVLLAQWRHLSLLLTADAEAEAVPLDPGPVDVLKVAHHGSEDAGLAPLLQRAAPRLAVISVGENSYGHPAAETLATLESHSLPVLRTDQLGTIEIEADRGGWQVQP